MFFFMSISIHVALLSQCSKEFKKQQFYLGIYYAEYLNVLKQFFNGYILHNSLLKCRVF